MTLNNGSRELQVLDIWIKLMWKGFSTVSLRSPSSILDNDNWMSNCLPLLTRYIHTQLHSVYIEQIMSDESVGSLYNFEVRNEGNVQRWCHSHSTWHQLKDGVNKMVKKRYEMELNLSFFFMRVESTSHYCSSQKWLNYHNALVTSKHYMTIHRNRK